MLSDVSFIIHPQERLTLVGANGVGKTTLLRILVGENQPDSGEVVMPVPVDLGYLQQVARTEPGQTIEGLLRAPDLLLLDEPTNHVDLPTLEAFEAALLRFHGAILAVSHDRWFIERMMGSEAEVWATLVAAPGARSSGAKGPVPTRTLESVA